MMKNKTKLLDGNPAGVSQLLESRHKYPIELWKKACANNWMPQSVNMSEDIKQWKEKGLISDDERLLIKRTLGLFAAGESLVSNSIMLNEYKYVTDGACRQYLLRKSFEESLHNFTVSVCCEAYGLDVHDVAEAYKSIKTIKAKDQFLEGVISDMGAKDFNIETIRGKQDFVRNIFTFYIICEGCWFYPNFAMILSLGRQNKLRGLCDQIAYTMRDETLHFSFGVYLINELKKEYPEIWTNKFQNDLIDLMKEAMELEVNYSKEVLPNGILGVNSQMLVEYVQFLANDRLEQVGLDHKFPSVKNPFPWLGETQDSSAMTAFFEVRNKDYQNAGALIDDF